MHPRSFRPSFAGSRSDERRFCPTGSRPRKQQLDQNVRVGRSEIFDMQGALRSETEVAQLSSVDASQSRENGEPDGASAGIYFGPRRQSFESTKIVSSQRLGALPWCTLRRRNCQFSRRLVWTGCLIPRSCSKAGNTNLHQFGFLQRATSCASHRRICSGHKQTTPTCHGVQCLGCDTHQTVALDIVRRPKTTPNKFARCALSPKTCFTRVSQKKHMLLYSEAAM
jgi:hypothetical protein